MGLCCPAPTGLYGLGGHFGGATCLCIGALVLATMSVDWWREVTSGSCFQPVVALSLDTLLVAYST